MIHCFDVPDVSPSGCNSVGLHEVPPAEEDAHALNPQRRRVLESYVLKNELETTEHSDSRSGRHSHKSRSDPGELGFHALES